MSSDKLTWPKPGQKMEKIEGDLEPLFTFSIIDEAFNAAVQRFFVPAELLDNHPNKEKKE